MTITRKLCTYLAWAGLAFLGAAPVLAEAGDPPATVARLGGLEGSVSVQPSGVNEWSQADVNYPVATGDRVYADKDGRAELSIGRTVARMWHNTDLTMTNLNDQITQLGLAQGTLRLRTFALEQGAQVEVDTPNGAISVTRPGDIRVDSYDEQGGTVVEVNSGAVEVTGPNLSQEIGPGQAVRLAGSNPIELSSVEMPGLDPFDNWSIQRDRRLQDAQSARYVSRDTVGYDDLDEYGTWNPDTEYGPVWYPRQVNAGWVPYREGHWVWTGPWGWTWVEDEPWGYAPFHYGRWAYIDDRWGWVPGPIAVRPIWSPALVAFAGDGGFAVGVAVGGLAAWFPLGVGEPYIPWYHCSPAYVRQVNVTNINIVNIHNTTIVNNYNNFVKNTDNYQNLSNVRNVSLPYSNREHGFTAVNQRAFSSAQPVARNVVSVPVDRIRNAQVIAHPSIRPTPAAVVPHPARTVPVPMTRPTLLTQGGRMAQAVPNARPQAVPFRPLPQNAQGQNGVRPNLPNRSLPNGGPAPVARPGQTAGQTVGPVQTPGQGQRPIPGAVPQNRPGQTAGPGGQPAGVRPNAPNETLQQRPLITRSGPTTQPGRPLPQGNQPPQNRLPQGQSPNNQPLRGQSERQPAINNAQPRSPGGQQGMNSTPPSVNNQPARPLPQGNAGGNSGAAPRPLITRNESPAQRPSFEQQRRTMPDPGRPLEPGQMDNLSQGRRPGPSQDQEAYPHNTPAPQQQPRYSQPAPQQQPRYSQPAPQQQPRYSPPPQQAQPRYSQPAPQQPAPQQQPRYSQPAPQQQPRYSPPPQQAQPQQQQRSAPPQQQRSAPEQRQERPAPHGR